MCTEHHVASESPVLEVAAEQKAHMASGVMRRVLGGLANF